MGDSQKSVIRDDAAAKTYNSREKLVKDTSPILLCREMAQLEGNVG